MSIQNPIKVDLTIIGTGMAGMAATLFAANRGLSVAQVGNTSEIGFASGLFDLLSIHPTREGKQWDDPWAAIETLARDIPGHPYTRIQKKDIQKAFGELLYFLEGVGLPYSRNPAGNVRIVTPLGTVKTNLLPAPNHVGRGGGLGAEEPLPDRRIQRAQRVQCRADC